MNHDGFMIGMMLGGALVASVPTLLVISVGVYVLRQHRARKRAEAAAGAAWSGHAAAGPLCADAESQPRHAVTQPKEVSP